MREPYSRYSTVSIVLHWTIAVLVIVNVLLGGAFEDAAPPDKVEALMWHKSVGVTIFALTLLRLGWRIAHPWPPLPETTPGWQGALARFTHVAFYVLLLAIPLMGWATVSAAGAPAVPLYGVIPWPNLPLPRGDDLADGLGDTHKTLVKAVYVLLALHVAGALKHHFLDKDVVLSRMLPIVRPKG